MCFRLLDRNHYLLPLVGSRVPLEIAIGVNGRIWVSSDTPHNVILITRCIESFDESGADEAAMRNFIQGILSSR